MLRDSPIIGRAVPAALTRTVADYDTAHARAAFGERVVHRGAH